MMNTDVCNGLTVPEVAPWTSSSSSSSSMTATCLDDGFRCKSGIHVLEQDRVRVARTSENIIADTSVTGTQCLCAADSIATQFYRFLARFSGRRRRRVNWQLLHIPLPHTWFWLALFISTLFPIADTCSSRATPKPRPPAPTPRPNITFHTYTCPPAYAAWYCLNGATCFTVKIENSLLYNCECANGYIGPRCEYKDLDGSYLPSQRRFMLETASIAGGATIAVFLVFIVCIATYIRVQKRAKTRTAMATSSNDCVDGHASNFSTNKRVFGNPWRDQIPKNVNILTMPLDNIPTVTMSVTDRSNQECATTQPDVHWTRHQITGSDRVQSCVPP